MLHSVGNPAARYDVAEVVPMRKRVTRSAGRGEGEGEPLLCLKRRACTAAVEVDEESDEPESRAA